MTTAPFLATPTASATGAWDRYTRLIEAVLGANCAYDSVTLRRANHSLLIWVQEATSIAIWIKDDPAAAPLLTEQRAALAAQGWSEPTGDMLWSRSVPWRPEPATFAQAAKAIVYVLRTVLHVTSPNVLTAEANTFDDEREFGGCPPIPYPIDEPSLQRTVAHAAQRQANLTLACALADHAMAKTDPHARLIARIPHPGSRRKTLDAYSDFFLDTVYLIPSPYHPYLLFVSHIGPTGLTARREARMHPHTRRALASQGTAAYIRHLIQADVRFATALRDDPSLHAEVTALLATGRPDVVRARSYAFDGENTLTATILPLHPSQLDTASIAIPPLDPNSPFDPYSPPQPY